jgi:hypothetical protein
VRSMAAMADDDSSLAVCRRARRTRRTAYAKAMDSARAERGSGTADSVLSREVGAQATSALREQGPAGDDGLNFDAIGPRWVSMPRG